MLNLIYMSWAYASARHFSKTLGAQFLLTLAIDQELDFVAHRELNVSVQNRTN
jgi:hypothetical protein